MERSFTNRNLQAYALRNVKITDEYLTNALDLELEYLLSFDCDRWLAGFRETAGLDMMGKTRYPGWEDSLIGGHAFGHYLSACAMMYNNPGVPDSDREKLSDMLSYLMKEVRKCMENSKGKKGFVFAAKILNRNNVEEQFDNVEEGKGDIFTEAWVPWYTMHKLLQGFIDVYGFTGNADSLEIARGIGEWTYERVTSWDPEKRNRVLCIEYGGMNDCLYELYAITGDDRFAEAAHVFDEETLFGPVLKGEKNVLNNRHANTTIPKFLGALKRFYYLDGKNIKAETVDASAYFEYAAAFFAMVRDRHTYITGGNSEWEHFGEDSVLDRERTNANNETCNVHNMLKIARLLFMITGRKEYADFYENAYVNTILSSQNPVTGMTTYFQPMATGYFKVYGERFTKFWCCIGTGMENFSKLGDSIYFSDGNDICVNMYLSSELSDDAKGLKLIQKSSVIYGGDSSFTLRLSDNEKSICLRFRIPDWAAGEMSLLVNGKKYATTVDSGYLCTDRVWHDGDVISVHIPMKLTAHSLPDCPNVFGFKYGPVVLSAKLGKEDMIMGTTGVDVTIPANKKAESEHLTLPAGISPDEFVKNPENVLVRNGSGLEFTFAWTTLVFTPHYSKYDERYGIYFYIDENAERVGTSSKDVLLNEMGITDMLFG